MRRSPARSTSSSSPTPTAPECTARYSTARWPIARCSTGSMTPWPPPGADRLGDKRRVTLHEGRTWASCAACGAVVGANRPARRQRMGVPRLLVAKPQAKLLAEGAGHTEEGAFHGAGDHRGCPTLVRFCLGLSLSSTASSPSLALEFVHCDLRLKTR